MHERAEMLQSLPAGCIGVVVHHFWSPAPCGTLASYSFRVKLKPRHGFQRLRGVCGLPALRAAAACVEVGGRELRESLLRRVLLMQSTLLPQVALCLQLAHMPSTRAASC